MSKNFFDRNKVVLILIFLLTVFLSCIALTPGLGYEANVHVEPWGGGRAPAGLIEGGSAYVFMFKGNLTVRFNPFFYPFTYLSGKSTLFMKFLRASEYRWDFYGHEVAKMVTLGVLMVEFAKNLPFLLAVSCFVSLGLKKIADFLKFKGLRQSLSLLRWPKED